MRFAPDITSVCKDDDIMEDLERIIDRKNL